MQSPKPSRSLALTPINKGPFWIAIIMVNLQRSAAGREGIVLVSASQKEERPHTREKGGRGLNHESRGFGYFWGISI